MADDKKEKMSLFEFEEAMREEHGEDWRGGASST